MNYDPSLENPMVTRQGGTLKGKVNINTAGTSDGYQNWVKGLSVTRPVSRPWVEWIKDELIDTEQMELTEKESGRSEGTLVTGISDYRGPRFVAVNQPRNVTFKYIDMNPYDKNGVCIYPAKLSIIPNTTDVSITPKSSVEGGQIKISLPVEPNVKIEVKGLSESQIETDVIIAVNLPDGRRKFIDTFPISVFDAGLAVDYNRDGEIHFHNDTTDPTKIDDVPVGKFYEFWLNDDYDELHPSEDEGIPEQDDLEIRTETVIVDQVPIQVPKPDYKLEKPSCERDLEDYARLHIKAPELSSDVFKDLKYKLYFTAMQEENPQIKVFPMIAKDSQGHLYENEEYLKIQKAAEDQLQASSISQLPVSKSYAYTGLIDLSRAVEIRKSKMPETGKLAPFLFEGVSKGSGKLNLSITDENGVELGRYKIPMKLKEITEFYEQFTVGDGDAEAPLTSCQDGNCAPTDAPFRYDSPTTDEEKDYVLFVHGWNMYQWEKKRFAETMFKRLYWLGYKGRVGLFRWPCGNGGMFDSNFWAGPRCHNSEYSAWRSGAGLKDILISLNQKGYRTHLLAHSQGAVVTGEALRKVAIESPTSNPAVSTYVVTQGAIPSCMWDSTKNTPPIEFCHNCGAQHDKPDVGGYFPDKNVPTSLWEAYFEKAKPAFGKMLNFYNQYDYAVGDEVYDESKDVWRGGLWKKAQYYKPLMENEYIFYDYPDWLSSKYYKYRDTDGKYRGDTFWYGTEVSGRQPRLSYDENHQEPPEDDRYRIFAYEYQSYSGSMGAASSLAIPGYVTEDLLTIFNIPSTDNKEANKRIYHSGQFRSVLANRRSYWYVFLFDMNSDKNKPR